MAGRISKNEEKYVLDVLNKEFRSSSGAYYMKKLEDLFCLKYRVKHAISFVNGTATMHCALEALGIGVGDEVIVPPLTMSATTFAVLQANATPIFADVLEATFNIDPESIKKRITNRTKAIITVSLYGLSAEMKEIKRIADEHNIAVIEDNAECFYGKYDNDWAGKIGDCASYSFQSSKHLTSGEGGMVTTDNDQLAEKIRQIQSLGYAGVSAKKSKISKIDIQDPKYKRHVSMGWNYRMPELCSAVALGQVERMEELVQRRVDVANIYLNETEQYHNWFRPQSVPKNCEHSYWTWACVNEREDLSWYDIRNTFIEFGGDPVYAAWELTYLEPMFQNNKLLGRENLLTKEAQKTYKKGSCPIAESLQPRLFQFKTNYWEKSTHKAQAQAKILKKTLGSL
ncbi:DegT/DnrJ/EryC1/StrS family aminotransferase [Synechococcus sp. YX-04-1]|uniref:DegT/DnrJ/EryC1/StrS family aminotransferase n=1 Tax=Synechococcus sp. YX-04-1 TaxID=3062778 RepID=UPI0026E2BA21|nr:DegT/DnrJ/EryC1/StrS family aminotransferase [Synechococcus sp. YX-04-1]MDO6351095.1 DegT/DnrJ/EryC1/StrS family aminotransferase [Synechococcus sp. YX-04-1]